MCRCISAFLFGARCAVVLFSLLPMRNIVETLKISLRLLTIDERHMFVTPELFLRLPNFLRLPEICLRVPNERSGSNDLAGKTRAGYNFSANGSDHSQ